MNIGVLLTSLLIGDLCHFGSVSGFVSQHRRLSIQNTVPTPLFLAKVKTRKQKNKSKSGTVASSGGGFGKSAGKADDISKPRPDDDYAIFPALEPQVQATLEATPPAMVEEIKSKGGLPMEIYDRLDQIYGFSDFNYEESPSVDKESSSESFSLEDLMAAPSPPEVSKSSTSPKVASQDTLDLNELLAAATGGPVDTLPTTGRSTTDDNSDNDEARIAMEAVMKDAITSLPPFEKINVLHLDPLVLTIEDFFTDEECDRYIEKSLAPNKGSNQKAVDSYKTRSKTVGKDKNAKSQRTSTTWFHHYRNVPELMAKASRLLGLDSIDRWEEPQTVRYKKNEKFTWHLDALSPAQSTEDLGGQRLATLLVYLKDLEAGGATVFRDLSSSDSSGKAGDGDKTSRLKVQPKKGSALLFFPAAGGIPNTPLDIRTLHCGEVVSDSSETDKWISQLWLRGGPYNPTAPPGNRHEDALENIKDYCNVKD